VPTTSWGGHCVASGAVAPSEGHTVTIDNQFSQPCSSDKICSFSSVGRAPASHAGGSWVRSPQRVFFFSSSTPFFFPLVIPQGSPETTPTQLEHTSVRFSVLSRSFGFLRPPLELTTIGSVMIALGTTGRTRFRNHHSFPAETMWIHVRRSALRQLEESSRNYGKIHQ
jgi:hypothetical protein